ncbi:hypothetical protein [Flavobacterium sp. 3HN19-14]|uniref:hypothetical protein n=1 Tax=Flavobacterium sp. 3HN19-14 TaxID=3448133 RepID=UPI003EE0FFA5
MSQVVLRAALTNSTYITSDTKDPAPDCLQCTDVDAQPSAEIQVTNTDGQTNYNVGSVNVRTYTVTVTNNGQ